MWDTVEDDVPGLYTALFDALAPLGLASVHALVTGEDDLLIALRKAWPTAFVVNAGGQTGPVPADQTASAGSPAART